MLDHLFKELQSAWKKTPKPIQLLFVVIAILNTVPLASLAEDIVKWKGFFLAGIDLYRSLTEPVRSFLQSVFQDHIPQWKFDFLVVYFLVWSSDFRSLKFFATPIRSSKLDWFFLPTLLLVLPCLFLGNATGTTPYYIAFSLMLLLLVFQMLFAIFLIYAGSKVQSILQPLDSDSNTSKLNILRIFSSLMGRAMSFFIYVFVAAGLVCIAAAINIGVQG